MNKLIIGTANFGLKYGIANNKQLNTTEIKEIIELANFNCFGIDLAKVYGEAENICSVLLKHSNLKIITKLPKLNLFSIEELKNLAIDSKKKLKRCDYILLHDFNVYKQNKINTLELFNILLNENIALNIGISIYHPHEALELLDDNMTNLTLEFPINIFDRRFSNELLQTLKQHNFILFARSIFLQGLFFLNPNSLDIKFKNAKNNLLKLNEISNKYNISIQQLALNFVYKNDLIDGVIIGIDSKHQLLENINSIQDIKNLDKPLKALEHLFLDDEKIILPYLW